MPIQDQDISTKKQKVDPQSKKKVVAVTKMVHGYEEPMTFVRDVELSDWEKIGLDTVNILSVAPKDLREPIDAPIEADYQRHLAEIILNAYNYGKDIKSGTIATKLFSDEEFRAISSAPVVIGEVPAYHIICSVQF